MVSPEEIKQSIERGLDCELVTVSGDGSHFESLIVSVAFAGKNKIQQHQLVYRALGDRMNTQIHALSLRTLTPEQWRALRQQS